MTETITEDVALVVAIIFLAPDWYAEDGGHGLTRDDVAKGAHGASLRFCQMLAEGVDGDAIDQAEELGLVTLREEGDDFRVTATPQGASALMAFEAA